MAQTRPQALIAIATVALFAITIIILAIGGRPDPPELRAQATLLNGPWRFHLGDDPLWSNPATNDANWPTIDLTATPGSHDGDVGLPDYVAGWMAHGYPNYRGYAWYRRTVTVPAGNTQWALLGSTLVEHAYELYWNGQLLGGSGRLGPTPRLTGTRPTEFPLPADAAGTTGTLAIRVYMLPRAAPSKTGGGIHSAPILAERSVSDGLHQAQWNRTIAGYVVDLIEPLAMFALIALALASRQRSPFITFACVALALTASRRLNNAIVAWTDLQDITTYAWLAAVMWIPTVTAWALAWNRWNRRASLSIDLAAVILALAATAGHVAHSPDTTRWSRLAFIALFVVIGATAPIRRLALVTFALILVTSFGGELLDPLGIPGIWFPLRIGVSRTQYLYAVIVPLLALLIVPSAETNSDKGTV